MSGDGRYPFDVGGVVYSYDVVDFVSSRDGIFGICVVVFSDGSVGFLTFAEIILKVLVLLCMSNETKVVFVIR